MAMIDWPEELAKNFSKEDVLLWIEDQLKTMRQMANKKEEDKAFVLGQVSIGLRDTASVISALRKKLNISPKDGGPVVA